MKRPGAIPLRVVLLGLALFATAAASHWSRHLVPMPSPGTATDLARLLPLHFGGWREDASSLLRPINPAAARQADSLYAQTVERIYVDASQRRVMLSVSWAGGQSDQLQAHRPEFCYQAQGFSVHRVRDDTLASPVGPLPVRRLETRRPGRSEPVSYWMTVGETAVLPGISRKLAQLRQGLSGKIPDGILVRVSSLDETAEDHFSLHDHFITDLLSALPAPARRRIAGAHAS